MVLLITDGAPSDIAMYRSPGTAYLFPDGRAFAQSVASATTMQVSFTDTAGVARSFGFDTQRGAQALSGVFTTCPS